MEDGLPPNRTKADATRWGCRVAWEHLKDVAQPPLRHMPPMSVKGICNPRHASRLGGKPANSNGHHCLPTYILILAKTGSKHANRRQNTHVSCSTSRECAASSWAVTKAHFGQ